MSRKPLVAALAGALLVVPVAATLLPASATPAASNTLRAPLPEVVPGDDEAFIQGAVVDRAGRYVDGVTVEAIAKSGQVEASSITYENPDEDQDHGFYRLYVSPGTYKIRIRSEKGDDQQFRTQVLSAKVKVRDGAVKELKNVVVTLRKPSASRTTVTLASKKVRADRSALVSIRVVCADVLPVTGRVQLTVDGRKRSVAVLTSRAKGKVVVAVPAGRKPGTHTVAATFLGNDAVRSSKAKPVTFVATRK